MYFYVYMCICIYVFMYICIYVYMYICIYVYMYICMYVYVYICIFVYMCIGTDVYIYIWNSVELCGILRGGGSQPPGTVSPLWKDRSRGLPFVNPLERYVFRVKLVENSF